MSRVTWADVTGTAHGDVVSETETVAIVEWDYVDTETGRTIFGRGKYVPVPKSALSPCVKAEVWPPHDPAQATLEQIHRHLKRMLRKQRG